MKAQNRGMTGLRLATAALAIAAGGLVIWQKHLLTRPAPGLVLVLACMLPFVADARYPRLFRSPGPGAAAVLLILGSAAALLAFRPTAGDAAVLFFIVLAARVAATAPPVFSVPAGILAVALPELVNLTDVRMKRVDGAEATRRLRAREGSPPVLVLTTFDEDEVLSASLRAGASGFQLKDAPGTELLKAVKTVAEGGSYLDLAVTARVLSMFRAHAQPPPRPPDASLTPRELEVLRLIGRGLSNGEIAAELFIGEVTVKAHLGHVLAKVGLRDRAAAIVYAFDTGLAGPGG